MITGRFFFLNFIVNILSNKKIVSSWQYPVRTDGIRRCATTEDDSGCSIFVATGFPMVGSRPPRRRGVAAHGESEAVALLDVSISLNCVRACVCVRFFFLFYVLHLRVSAGLGIGETHCGKLVLA